MMDIENVFDPLMINYPHSNHDTRRVISQEQILQNVSTNFIAYIAKYVFIRRFGEEISMLQKATITEIIHLTFFCSYSQNKNYGNLIMFG